MEDFGFTTEEAVNVIQKLLSLTTEADMVTELNKRPGFYYDFLFNSIYTNALKSFQIMVKYAGEMDGVDDTAYGYDVVLFPKLPDVILWDPLKREFE